MGCCDDWGRLEGCDAFERLFCAAIECGAREIHLTSDGCGCTILFHNEDTLSIFRHLPIDCRDKLRAYLRQASGVDAWKEAPVSGVGVFSCQDQSYQLEVNFIRGNLEEDIRIRLMET